MTLSSTSMPSGWKALVGTFGTDIVLKQTSSTQFMSNDKYLQLKDTTIATGTGTEVAPSILSGQIPFRPYNYDASTRGAITVSVAYQVSRANAGDNITIALKGYTTAGIAAGTIYLVDEAGTSLNATNAAGTGIAYAHHTAYISTGAYISYYKLEVTKANTAFTLDIHGVHVRSDPANNFLSHSGAAVNVPDSFASPAWTTITTSIDNYAVRMYDYLSTSGYSASPAYAGLFHCHAVVKCEDVPLASEFAVRIAYVDNTGTVITGYQGQRIVGGGNSMTWQISASHAVGLIPGTAIAVQCQHIGNGAAGNLSVELMQAYVVDCLPWQ